jgi:uncharacterized protein
LQALETTPPARSDRTLQLALFVTSVTWFLTSDVLAGRAARGISERLNMVAARPLLGSLFLLFLLAVGFSALQAISARSGGLREVLGLPERSTAGREWALGAAIGWGGMVLAVLPMALAGTWSVRVWTGPRAFGLLVLNLATLAVASLVEELGFRGFPYRRLIQAVGPVAATIALSVFFGLVHMLNPAATWTSVLVTMLAGMLLSVAWLRTHGLWLGWGLHFAWNASMGVLFGLPVSGINDFASVIQTRAFGRLWLTGGDYGPEGAFFTLIVLLIAIGVLVAVTRDFAWEYTFKPIVAGGYAMDVAPPAEHTAMEQQAAAKPSLVQILPSTPQSRSVEDEPKS